jgi:hypothetical protein
MSTNAKQQPIDLASRRASRDASRSVSLTVAQQRAYRQLAIAALGLDLPTLTRELRARRLQRMPLLQLLPPTDRAA